jgi:hypothetical protein
MEYNLQPKKKSEVQFNGEVGHDKNWAVPFVSNVQKEFDSRYDIIKKQYEELLDEVYWNSIIYKTKINFKPVIGHTYYLYKESEEKYILSLIAPCEWKKVHVGSFMFNYTGKWIKVN